MPREVILCDLSTHMPVEVGDTLRPRGMREGLLHRIDGHEVALRHPEGVLTSSLMGFGLGWLDSEDVLARPHSGPVDHCRRVVDQIKALS